MYHLLLLLLSPQMNIPPMPEQFTEHEIFLPTISVPAPPLLVPRFLAEHPAVRGQACGAPGSPLRRQRQLDVGAVLPSGAEDAVAGDYGEGVVAGAAGVVAAHHTRPLVMSVLGLCGFGMFAVVRCGGIGIGIVSVTVSCCGASRWIEGYDLRGVHVWSTILRGAGRQHVLVVTIVKRNHDALSFYQKLLPSGYVIPSGIRYDFCGLVSQKVHQSN